MPENPVIRQLPRNLIEQILRDPGFVQMFEDMMRGVGVTLPENILIAQDTADQALIATQPAEVEPTPEPAFMQPEDVFDLIYPIGATVIRDDTQDPNTLFGRGVWERVHPGRFMVNYLAGDPDFGTIGATGGAKTTTVDPHDDHTHDVTSNVSTGTVTVSNSTLDVSVLTTPINNPTVTSTGVDAPTTGELEHEPADILPPFVVIALWKRTA